MWDGYELTLQGQPRLALGTAALDSGIGGLLSGLALMFLSPLLADVALEFGPAEYVAIVLFGLVAVTVLLGGSMLRSATGVFVGLALALTGLDPLRGFPRLDFGVSQLSGGLEVAPVLLGIFCLAEAVNMAANNMRHYSAERSASTKPRTGAGVAGTDAGQSWRGRAGRSAAAPSNAEVRCWARQTGLTVSDRGRVSPSVMTAYRNAHQ